MIIVRHIFLLLAMCLASVAQGQTNVKPRITGQFPLNTFKNVPITVQFSNLIVFDSDDIYPIGFTLKLYAGKKFTFNGTTVTPEKDFVGTLTVPVSVNDGQDESNKFDLKIEVLNVNIPPIITGQQPLSTYAGEKITLALSNLTVVDPDNTYPDDFTLAVMAGSNYTVSGQTVTPNADFAGTLIVPVSVHDGQDTSPAFNLQIEVIKRVNIPPVITGQDVLSINEDHSITVELNDLVVTDPDNEYPIGFTLKIPQGAGINYSVSGTKVTPAPNYFGTLSVNGVVVNDGKADSNPFDLQITVKAVNDQPLITGQVPLTTFIATPITIQFSDLLVTDPDLPPYPSGFTLKIAAGFNYKVDGNVITPARNFLGTLKANVTVTDGAANSNTFELQIRVIPLQNIPPVITGQTGAIVITENRPPAPPNQLTIQFSHLLVTDPDNPNYPAGFTLSVFPGANYTVSGVSITPAANFTGILSVGVSVNDGQASSNVFSLQVSVIPISATPQIVGQNPLMINEDESIVIALTDLIVTDADDNYPEFFTLQIFPDPDGQYTVNKNTVIPKKDLNGFLTVIVRVKDNDNNASNAFNLSILINAVNDAPVITQLETTELVYQPGTEPLALTAIFNVEDVDSDHLSFASIRFGAENYQLGYDELLFNNTVNVRGVFDAAAGELSLIGYATLAEYVEAVRAVAYNYNLFQDEHGNGDDVPPGTKTISLQVHDGQLASETKTRNLTIETTATLDIPSAFSPNGDGANETWNIQALSNAERCENAVIQVYDKRGLLLFQAIGLSKQWDGTFNGVMMPTDTYFYTIDLNLSYSKVTYSGVITILR